MKAITTFSYPMNDMAAFTCSQFFPSSFHFSPSSTSSFVSSIVRVSRVKNTKMRSSPFFINVPRESSDTSVICCISNSAESRTREKLHEYVSTYTSGADPDLQRLRSLLDGSKLSVPDVWLLFAARVGDPETVEALLVEGANPNVSDSEGSTPLMRSVSRGHVSVVKVLLEDKRIDITAKNNWGYDAVIYAGSVKNSKPGAFKEICALFEDFGADSSRSELRWTQKPKKS